MWEDSGHLGSVPAVGWVRWGRALEAVYPGMREGLQIANFISVEQTKIICT